MKEKLRLGRVFVLVSCVIGILACTEEADDNGATPPLNENMKMLHEYEYAVRGTNFSKDGSVLAACISSGWSSSSIILFDTKNGSELGILTGHTDWTVGVSFSPDGSTIASGARDGTLKLWNAQTQEMLHSHEGHMGPDNTWKVVMGAAFSQDGKTVYSRGSSLYASNILITDVASGEAIEIIAEISVFGTVFNGDHSLMAIGEEGGGVQIYDTNARTVAMSFAAHDTSVYSFAFSPGGSYMATTTVEGQMRIWDAATAALKSDHLIEEVDEQHRARVIGFNRDGSKLLFTVTSYGADAVPMSLVKILDGDNGNITQLTDQFSAFALSPDRTKLAVGLEDGKIQFWDIESETLTSTLDAHSEQISKISFPAQSNQMFTAGQDDFIRIWQ